MVSLSHIHLSALLLAQGKRAEAVELLHRGLAVAPEQPNMDAIAAAKRAIELANAADLAAQPNTISDRLRRYEDRQPYHEQ